MLQRSRWFDGVHFDHATGRSTLVILYVGKLSSGNLFSSKHEHEEEAEEHAVLRNKYEYWKIGRQFLPEGYPRS